jgi:hypothetical protein
MEHQTMKIGGRLMLSQDLVFAMISLELDVMQFVDKSGSSDENH